MTCKIGFNQTYNTFTLILLIKIVLRSKFPRNCHMCFDIKSLARGVVGRRRASGLSDAACCAMFRKGLLPDLLTGFLNIFFLHNLTTIITSELGLTSDIKAGLEKYCMPGLKEEQTCPY